MIQRANLRKQKRDNEVKITKEEKIETKDGGWKCQAREILKERPNQIELKLIVHTSSVVISPYCNFSEIKMHLIFYDLPAIPYPSKLVSDIPFQLTSS